MRRALLVALALAAPAAAQAAPPPRLQEMAPSPNLQSSYGSGAFGRWGVDRHGLPRYRYTLNELTSPIAPQAELNGSRDAWHQLGNNHIVAMAFNHGYTELWSQDHQYEWLNYADAGHTAGGYGIISTGGKTYSTLRDDAGGTVDFGIGYVAHHTGGTVTADERVYAPYGDAPMLLHDVRLRNTTAAPVTLTWTEVWDPNPYVPGLHLARPITAPEYHDGIVTVDQTPVPDDNTPDRIFAAALTSTTGHDGFHLQNTITLKPGHARTLRYAFGAAPADQIAGLVAHPGRFAATERAWQRVLPRSSFGRRNRWLARELQWDDYMVKSGETYEACAGHHIVSQGGYYQYGLGFQGAFRDPLQHVLPLIYTDPEVTRETLLFSAQEQNPLVPLIPYAQLPGCTRFDLGTSDDLDLWLLMTAAEYGLATRDLSFFDQPVHYANGDSATLWEHLKRAFANQETQHGPHGEYIAGATGDWSDLITPLEQMTESDLVVAQAAYVYPRLAELADLKGDTGFAAELRTAGDKDKQTLANEWTGGWYARGYSALTQLGKGVIYGEPQPWAILAGVPSAAQATTLVGNIRRFLTGIGAPGGPARIGSSQSPAADDPDVTEKALLGSALGVGDGHAVFVGGQWFAVDGWLTWALGTLDGIVPHARAFAFDEFKRNTLAVRATVYPEHWNGIISVDDACRSWYSTNPAQCGVGLSSSYDTEIMHQPAWSLYAMTRLAGITPDAGGYTIAPHLPLKRFRLELPEVGVAKRPGLLRGYVKPAARMVIRVKALGRVFVDGRRVHARAMGGYERFVVTGPADWAVQSRP